MTSHNDVANRLFNPQPNLERNTLKGTNMTYVPGVVPIVEGYDWATYAARLNRTAFIFEDWRGYSTSTTQHLCILERAARTSPAIDRIVYVQDSKQTLRRNQRPETVDQLKAMLPDPDHTTLGEKV